MPNSLSWPARLRPFTAALYLGVVLGVSFIATPAKFMAPLPLADHLQIGRVTFSVLQGIELGLVVALFMVERRWLGPAIVAALVLAQFFWLRPLIDARVDVFVAGDTPEPAPWHHLYVGAELVKVIVLAVVALRGTAPPPPR